MSNTWSAVEQWLNGKGNQSEVVDETLMKLAMRHPVYAVRTPIFKTPLLVSWYSDVVSLMKQPEAESGDVDGPSTYIAGAKHQRHESLIRAIEEVNKSIDRIEGSERKPEVRQYYLVRSCQQFKGPVVLLSVADFDAVCFDLFGNFKERTSVRKFALREEKFMCDAWDRIQYRILKNKLDRKLREAEAQSVQATPQVTDAEHLANVRALREERERVQKALEQEALTLTEVVGRKRHYDAGVSV